MTEVTVDFISRDQTRGGWALILVEEGPWQENTVANELRRIQDRLYGCLDAALDGAVTGLYPDSLGSPLMIRLDAYDLPELPLRDFFATFSSEVVKLPDYVAAIASQPYFSRIEFELNVTSAPRGV